MHYSPGRRQLTLEVTRAHRPGTADHHSQTAPLDLPAGEPLVLRVFLDRSVIEVFANDRQCLTKRIYPDPGSLGMAFYCWGGNASLRTLDVWEMASIWD